jgi:hypothetical protein
MGIQGGRVVAAFMFCTQIRANSTGYSLDSCPLERQVRYWINPTRLRRAALADYRQAADNMKKK